MTHSGNCEERKAVIFVIDFPLSKYVRCSFVLHGKFCLPIGLHYHGHNETLFCNFPVPLRVGSDFQNEDQSGRERKKVSYGLPCAELLANRCYFHFSSSARSKQYLVANRGDNVHSQRNKARVRFPSFATNERKETDFLHS